MKLDKLYSKEEQDRMGHEMRHLYFDEDWTKEKIRVHYELSHETLKEFSKQYGLVKTSSQYNKKAIDRKFSKNELNELAECIRVDFLDNLLLESELEDKYGLTWTDLQNIKKRYGIVETNEQHWRRTQRANLLKHGVSHMSHIEGSREKASNTYKNNIETNLKLRLSYYRAVYGDDINEDEFIRIRLVLRDKEQLKKEILKYDLMHRSYPYFSRLWHISEDVLMEIFDKFDLKGLLCYNHGYSPYEAYIFDTIKGAYPSLSIICHERSLINPQELDIYIPELQFAIEVNGSYWHCDKNVNKHYHQNKSKVCLEKGIQLFHAFEKDLEEDFEGVLDKICTLINMLMKGNVDAVGYYTCDFCEDNGAALCRNGYMLESLSEPSVRYVFDHSNVYDSGTATFRRVEVLD